MNIRTTVVDLGLPIILIAGLATAAATIPLMLIHSVNKVLDLPGDTDALTWAGASLLMWIFWGLNRLDFNKLPNLGNYGYFTAVAISAGMMLAVALLPALVLMLINATWAVSIPFTVEHVVHTFVILALYKALAK